MGFRRGIIVGLGIGYVMGTKAGRERYEDIRRAWGRITGNAQVQRAAGRTKDLAADGARKGLHAVQEGVEKAGEAVKERLHKDDELQVSAAGFVPPTTATP